MAELLGDGARRHRLRLNNASNHQYADSGLVSLDVSDKVEN